MPQPLPSPEPTAHIQSEGLNPYRINGIPTPPPSNPTWLCWQLRRSTRPSRLLWLVLLLFNALGVGVLLFAARYPTSLYVRNALFSQVLDDSQVPTEQAVNIAIDNQFQRDPPQLNPRDLFSQAALARLDGFTAASQAATCRLASDHPRSQLTPADCLARKLTEDVSPYLMGGKCGLDGSLRARIGMVRNGVGCCSDYNEAFLLRAKAVGLEAREVHNMGHTMAEYYDPAMSRWKWIDTSNRVQMSNSEGELINSWQRRSRLPWRGLQFVDLPPHYSNISVREFPGFQSDNNGIIFWTRGSNFQQQEAFEAHLRRIGLPRELVQIASLTVGVRPGWLVLAPQEAAFRFRLSAWLLKAGLLLFVLADGVLLAAALGWRVTRNRPPA